MFAALVLLACQSLSAQNNPNNEVRMADSLAVEADPIRFSFETGLEVWNGFTEYEIEVGEIVYGPTGELLEAGSRLRFPVDARMIKLGAAADWKDFSLSASFLAQTSNDEGTFKDYDWFIRDGNQNAFWFGLSNNDDYSKRFDLNLSYAFESGSLVYKPQIQFSYVGMRFDENGIRQTDYYYINRDNGQLFPYEEPQKFTGSGHVLKYKIDYKILSAGGSVTYSIPFGLDLGATLLVSPITWADDLDNHLLRDKDSESSTTGTAGHVEATAGFRFCRFARGFAAFSYDFVNTSGNQTQVGPDPDTGERVTYSTTIPVTTKAEWTSFKIGLTIDINPPLP